MLIELSAALKEQNMESQSTLISRFPWINQFSFVDGKAYNAAFDLGLGAVTCMRSTAGRILSIRKSKKPGYQFSDNWAMPGGMIKSSDDSTSVASRILDNLQEDFLRETSLQLDTKLAQFRIGTFQLSQAIQSTKNCAKL